MEIERNEFVLGTSGKGISFKLSKNDITKYMLKEEKRKYNLSRILKKRRKK